MDRARERLFAPTSALWKVSRENVLLLGGPAAAILQTAHPQVALGVERHSDFKRDTLGRLYRTLNAVYTITFGRRSEVEAMARRVRERHAPVQGTGYSAFSPEAQFWVLATLIALSVEIYERLVGKLTQAEREEYFRGMKSFGRWFGLPEDYGPATWVDFAAYYQGMLESDELGSLPVSTELARHIAYPETPAFLRLGWPVSGFCTREFLPSPVRERLGLPRGRFHQRAAATAEETLRFLLPALPDRVRYTPHYLRALREDESA